MDLVKFFEVTNILKRLPRTGWLIKGIKNPESIAAHSFSTTLLALIMGIDRKDINLEELLIMSIVHDLGESYLGDLTPSSINLLGGKEHKDQLEKKAIMQLFMLLDENRRDKLLEVYEAYSNNETDEAKLLHQIDKLDMLFQAIEYQKAGYPKEHLQEFWDAAESSIIDEKLIEIIRHLKERYR